MSDRLSGVLDERLIETGAIPDILTGRLVREPPDWTPGNNR